MRAIDGDLIKTLINFSQGAWTGYDPSVSIGCQRESLSDLGFGWLYVALARVLEARRALVIGSGRGFSAACLALAMEDREGSEVVLADPGYTEWKVNGRVEDRACGLWSTPEADTHFEGRLGLRNVVLLRLRSDEVFERFRSGGASFDIVLVDGDHGYPQALADFRNAAAVLGPGGLILAHDAHCFQWPGVALALRVLMEERPDMEKISLPCYPGLAVVQMRPSLISFCHSTVKENDTINEWRRSAGINTRPLSPGIGPEGEPRPGTVPADPREGLFSVFENGKLIGGFGLRYREFISEGADDFLPFEGRPARGYLRYGSVLRPDARGRGRWQLLTYEILRMLEGGEFYGITKFGDHADGMPYIVSRVGVCGPYDAYLFKLRTAPGDEREAHLRKEIAGLISRDEKTRARCRELESRPREIKKSLAVRLSDFVRRIPLAGPLLLKGKRILFDRGRRREKGKP